VGPEPAPVVARQGPPGRSGSLGLPSRGHVPAGASLGTAVSRTHQAYARRPRGARAITKARTTKRARAALPVRPRGSSADRPALQVGEIFAGVPSPNGSDLRVTERGRRCRRPGPPTCTLQVDSQWSLGHLRAAGVRALQFQCNAGRWPHVGVGSLKFVRSKSLFLKLMILY
jgi:hypothetical protein